MKICYERKKKMVAAGANADAAADTKLRRKERERGTSSWWWWWWWWREGHNSDNFQSFGDLAVWLLLIFHKARLPKHWTWWS